MRIPRLTAQPTQGVQDRQERFPRPVVFDTLPVTNPGDGALGVERRGEWGGVQPPVSGLQSLEESLHESGFTNAGFPGDKNDLPLASQRVFPPAMELDEFAVSAYQIGFRLWLFRFSDVVLCSCTGHRKPGTRDRRRHY